MNEEDVLRDLPASERNAVVAVYDRHETADEAVRLLRDAGVDPTKLAVIGRGMHSENRVVGFYNRAREVKHWGGYGALWGGVWGWLVLGFFWVPGIGHLTAAGWIVWNLAAAAGGAALGGGIGAVAAALQHVGIPDDVIPEYESALKADNYLVIVHGTPDEVDAARRVLDGTDAVRIDSHVGATSVVDE